MNIRDLIRSVDGGGDYAEVARVALGKVFADLSPEDQFEVILPLVRSEVVRMRRHRVRRQEDTAFAQAPDDLSALRSLRDTPFMDLTEHRSITWGEATRKQHLARARLLHQKQVERTTLTITRHKAAARLIAEHHVQRLNDLPGFRSAA